jgi:hypothetical protein
MPPDTPYAVVVAPQADAQIKAASAWWRDNRKSAPDLLRDELGAALLLLAERPEIGRRIRNRRLGSVRLLVLRRTSYVLYYRVVPAAREAHVVHLRHARRRPLRLR